MVAQPVVATPRLFDLTFPAHLLSLLFRMTASRTDGCQSIRDGVRPIHDKVPWMLRSG